VEEAGIPFWLGKIEQRIFDREEKKVYCRIVM
jgi:hypothetical protein